MMLVANATRGAAAAMAQSEVGNHDPYHGRRPTAHERQAGQPWDASYRDSRAPWDIGAPQPALVRLVDSGAFRGEALDAAVQGLEADFAVADALNLGQLSLTFDVVLNCALFHALDTAERRVYVQGLEAVIRPGADLFVLCFGDTQAGAVGPHPVSREDLRAPIAQAGARELCSISPERLYATFAPEGVFAWLAAIRRVGST